ncbi:hypothetical protein P879_04468 [Paragonimus westermani]|uniref:CRAL-TRIO domain-containing protein n=1 Tax=Paragonimus westermani TaxID=34504 RepID=A0A8T0DJ87_9TREM|nr:hypothetical protein P879_04468 [Paragonimus westermani]
MMSGDIAVLELPEELKEKASTELNEWEHRRDEAIAQLRALIQTENLHGCLSDGFLLRFLRARKFDLNNALHSYRLYYETRTLYPDIFSNLRPSCVQHVFTECVVARLPSPNDAGCPMLYFQPGRWDPDCWPSTDLFRANILMVEELLLRCPATQVHGVVILVDLTDLAWRHGVHMIGPSFIRRTARFIQGCTPVRVKAIHIYNEPLLFSRLFSTLRPLLKEKIRKRIKLHGTSLDSLHSSIPPHLLPANCKLKGTGPEIPCMNYMRNLMELDEYFTRMNHFPIIRRPSAHVPRIVRPSSDVRQLPQSPSVPK